MICSFDYEYHAVGNRTKVTEANGDYINYTYDELYRLLTETKKDSSNTQIYKYVYTYDAVGNRLAMTNTGTTNYTYDAANKLTQAGNISYNYDNNGNLTSKTDPSGTTNYTYDFRNKLIKVTFPDNSIVKFAYDGDGNRVKKVDKDGNTTNFFYDTNLGLAAILFELHTSDTLKATYILRRGLDKYGII